MINEKRIYLYVNQTGKPVQLDKKGDIITRNRYNEGMLENNGYVIWSLEKNSMEEKG